MTRLLIADVTSLSDTALFERLYGEASPGRKAICDSFRFESDRRLSIGAAALLDYGLEEYGLREKDMSYGRTEYGKPFFLNAPEIHFNISHSSSKVAVAFSSEEIGCDIEEVTDIDPVLAERYFCKKEYERVMSEPDGPLRNDAFFRIWTMKESYLKASGRGLSVPLESFCVLDPIDGFSFVEIDSFEGYKCSLCGSSDSLCSEVKVERVIIG